MSSGQMRLIAFIRQSVEIRKIVDHIGVDFGFPHISLARSPLTNELVRRIMHGQPGRFFYTFNPCHTRLHAVEFPIRCPSCLG